MHYIAEQIVKVLKEFQSEILKYEPVRPNDEVVIQKGLQVSANATRQEEYVHPTPIMKNALVLSGECSQYQENGEWHTTKRKADGRLGKAAETLLSMLEKAMIKEFGPKVTEYPEEIPFTDEKYYFVDCWNFFDELPKKFWDIVPGQEDEVKERFDIYSNPKTNMSLNDMIKFVETSTEMQKALEIEQKIWPFVQASRDITAISDPFMSKKSGVSYPDFSNDSKTVPGTDMTYGAYEIDLARKAWRKGLKSLIKFFYDNNVYTGYTRRQLGKGRALIAESRRANLVVNMVNAVEMENIKDTKCIQIPFLDEDAQLRELSIIAELCLKNGFVPVNIDASSWDQNLGEGPLVLQDAERYLLGQGSITKEIIKARTIGNTKAYFFNGPKNAITKIYGRQFSGYDDTTLGNTKCNRTTATCSAIKTDRKYVTDIVNKMRGYHVLTVGDDLLIVLRSYKQVQDFIKHETEDFGFVIHGDEKFAKGVFFIQWRVFKHDGKYVMAYNVPRVFRSMLSKEDAKHLGRGGWTFAFWQQLSKLRRYPKALRIVVNILAAYDQYHLSIDTPVSELLKMVKEEDRESLASKKSIETTAERMYRSNPNISGLTTDKDGKVVLDGKYFRAIQKQLKAVYDPNYLQTLGFANPDLSRIH